MATQLYWPFDPALVSEWPGERGANTHYGTDFKVDENTPLVACFDGVVAFAAGDGARGELYPGSGIFANGEGLTVDIVRSDGLRARYGHMNHINVTVGQVVKAGDRLGLSGNTGFTTGPHCHWELRWDALWAGGAWVDPRSMDIKTFTSAHAKAWEDDLRAVSGSTTKKVDQVIKANTITHVITADPSSVTLASGPGDVVGLNATVRLKGKKGKRVEVTMVVEAPGDKRVKTLGQQRTAFDTLGYAAVEVSGSTPLKQGEMIRVLVQTEAAAGDTTVVDYYWNGYKRD